MRNRFTLFLVLIAALVIALPVVAQEQVGGIEGVVKDAEGSVLPGVTVEASSPAIGTVVGTTSASGTYRFPRLPIGVYAVKASLEGYKPAEVKGIGLALGQVLTINMSLEVGSFEETIVVTGEGAQIDVTNSVTATSFAREQLELFGGGRDFTAIAAGAAGASQEAFAGGISIDGASGSENRFVIDGIDTTHPQDGLSGQDMVTDFLEEVQVKSAGYTAEYGGSVGGVINAVTKSGTNEFQGWVGAYLTDSSMNGSERPTYYASSPTLYRTFEKDDDQTIEPSLGLGGPIARDKAWFFVSYQPKLREINRTPSGSSLTFSQDEKDHYFSGNVKGNVGSKFLYKVSANLNPYERDGALPARDNSTPASADLSVKRDSPTESYSAYADFVPTSSFYLTGRVGFFSTDINDTGLEAPSQFQFVANTPDIPVPTSDPRYRPNGFLSVPNLFQTNEDLWEREAAGLDANLFVSGGGQHAFKSGVQYEKITNSVDNSEVGNNFRIRWNTTRSGVRGTYGSVEVRSFATVGSATSENLGVYLQDSWQVLPNLTVNLGVRAEEEKVPNYPVNVPDYGKYAFEFGFQDKLAPRAGFSWDVTSDQRWKVYGSYGKYYDITKLEMPRGSFGADHWIAFIYPLNTLDWETLDDSCHQSTNNRADNPCPGLGTPGRITDFRLPTNPAENIDPALEPMGNVEYQLGLDHQLTPNAVLGVRYVNKQLENTIEDIGFLICETPQICDEHYITGNPGKGIVAGDPEGPVPPQAEAVRDYEAIEVSWNRRFAGNWSARVGYTYSTLEGNYSGLASSDEFGRTDPNVARYFDSLHNAYTQFGTQSLGKLNTDRPNVVEGQFLYRAPWGTNIGINARWASGTPISEEAFFAGTPYFPYGRENLGRTPSISQIDLRVAHAFKIGDNTIEASVNVLNLTDADTATRYGNHRFVEDVCDVDADCDYTPGYFFGTLVASGFDTNAFLASHGATLDPQFKKPIAFQAARTIRLGLKFAF
jgi:hypothetical protein